MKKTLALVLAFALVFSTMTMAFAEDAAVGADAKVCTDLGMLVGDGSGVTANYLTTTPTRIQAAVMVLRLKGLEADAKAFTGTENFADADKATWAKPIMAYLKANPQLGWAGDGKNFDPAGKMTAQAYYKVMLETLGYKQNTDKVVGDFAWEKVIEFAASKGLTKAAAATNFTVSDLAAATVETLKANVKDTTKSLVATLVEAGKVDKAKAEAAGVLAGATTGAAELDSAIASANDKVEATFSADVDKAFAENVANYKVVVKGSTTALEVKAAKAVSTTVVELTTAAQTGGTAYTMTVGTASANFAGLAKITGAPEVDTLTCIDTNTLELYYTKAMDRASVEDVANYTLNNGATVKKAEMWLDQDDNRKLVKLTTEGVAKNKVYKLKIANVKSADLVAIKTVEKSFAGVTDTTAPKLDSVTVVNNERLFVVFDDAHGVDQAAAENVANWTIDGLKINSIKAKDYIDYNGKYYGDDDDYAYIHAVEINTEAMTANHKYTVTVSNMVDGSTGKNAITKALTKTFYGVAVDKTAPKVGQINVLSDNMVELNFTETNRLDAATATDINNYSFNEGLKVLSAKILKASAPDANLGKLVVLTTSTMDTDTTYKLTVENVADEFGNVMTKVSNRALERSKGADIKAPAVTKVVWADKNTVKVYFDERVDSATANDNANYSINGGIGVVRSAALSSSDANQYKRVTLTTPDLANNKSYKLTINGVKDRAGNEIANYTVSFIAGAAEADTDRPEIDNIVCVNENEIRVTFNESVKAIVTDANKDGVSDNVNMVLSDGTNARVVGFATPYYTIDDNTTVVFKTDAKIGKTSEYTVNSITGITDYHNNNYVVDASDKPTFYGNVDANEAPTVEAIDQTNMKTIKVTFSEPVLAPATITAGGMTFNASVDADDDETTDALSVVTLDGAGIISENKPFTFNFSGVKDYDGLGSTNTAYDYTAYLNDEDHPLIDYVESVSTTKVQIHFNEEVEAEGTYVIQNSDDKTVVTPLAKVDADDETIVNLTFANVGPSWTIKPGDVYTVIPKTAAKDIAGNAVENLKDLSFDFVASAVTNYDYIKGAKIVDAKTLEVYFTVAMDTTKLVSPDTLTVKDGDGNNYVGSIDDNGTKTLTVHLNSPLLDGVDYTIATTGAVTGSYAISGVLSDGGIDFNDATEVITFSGVNSADFTVRVVYGAAYQNVAWDSAKTILATAENGYVATTALNNMAGGAVPQTVKFIIEVYRNGDAAVLYSKEVER